MKTRRYISSREEISSISGCAGVGVVLNHTSFEPQVPDTAPEQTVGLHVRGIALALNLPLLAGAVTNYATSNIAAGLLPGTFLISVDISYTTRTFGVGPYMLLFV